MNHSCRARLTALFGSTVLLPCGAAIAAGPPAATTLPTGGTVVEGTASFARSGSQLTIDQLSQRLALDWSTFDIGSGAGVVFNQPSLNAIALNRIGIGSASPTPSQIFGSLRSNGQVFLINPAGIVFGSTASVDVGGLVASTLDMDPLSLFGRQSFRLDKPGTASAASVVNQGRIAANSSISLVGGQVLNSGSITARLGHINLDGADRAILSYDGNGLINVAINGPLSTRGTPIISNSGTLQAEGGNVVLAASGTWNIPFDDMINNSGVILANGIGGPGGLVQLVANGGQVTLAGGSRIEASAPGGGNVQITSNGGINAGGTVVANGGAIALNGFSLALSGGINAGYDGQISLIATRGGITQERGSLTAGFLTGSSGESTVLTQAGNAIGQLGGFSAKGFSLTTAGGLTVAGPLNSSGNLTLDTAHDLLLAGTISGDTVSLNVGNASTGYRANIEQTGGSITANTLTGSSTGRTALTRANTIGVLRNFTASGGFSLANARTLTVYGPLNGNGDVALATTNGDLVLDGDISGTNVALRADAGAISQVGGTLTATYLTGGSSGATTLTQARNAITALGAFDAGGFSLADGRGLTVADTLRSRGDVSLTAWSGDITLGGAVTGNTVALKAMNGAINQTSGPLTANILTGSSAGRTTLAQPGNRIDTLGDFSSNGFSLINAQALAVDGTLNGGTGGVALTTMRGGLAVNGAVTGDQATTTLTTADDLLVNGTVNAGVLGTLVLTSGGGIREGTDGTITAGVLTGSSAGDTSLGGANTVSQLGNFSSRGGFTLRSLAGIRQTTGSALQVFGTGNIDGGTGDIDLSNAGNSFREPVNLTGRFVKITQGGPLALMLGTVNARSLAATSPTYGILLTGDVDTVAGQIYNGRVVLASDVTLSNGGDDSFVPAIIFNGDVNGAHALTIDSPLVQFNGNIGNTESVASLTVHANELSLRSNISASGNIAIATTGDLALSGGRINAANVDLATHGRFINNTGADAIRINGPGRWHVYLDSPGPQHLFGGLDSGNTAIWNTAAFATTGAGGNRYLFAYQPTVVVDGIDVDKIYGDAADLGNAYTLRGAMPGVSGAYLGDTAASIFTGAPTLDSAGARAGADVGSYAIDLSTGTMDASQSGYRITLGTPGILTIGNAQSKLFASNADARQFERAVSVADPERAGQAPRSPADAPAALFRIDADPLPPAPACTQLEGDRCAAGNGVINGS